MTNARSIPRPRWTRGRRLLLGGSVVFLLISALSWSAYESRIARRFQLAMTEVPTRVFARPLVLYPGLRVRRTDIEAHLQGAGYRRATDDSVRSGEYRFRPGEWRIGRRPFRLSGMVDPGGPVRVRVLPEGRIASLSDGEGRPVPVSFLEPEPLGAFLGPAREDWVPVRLEHVPQSLVQAILSVEDRRFLAHSGLDLRRIVAASLADLRQRRFAQGGSTLTQQLARTLFLSRRRSLTRKLHEAVIAVALERRYDKQTLLEAYLNRIYMGQDGSVAVHGVGRAAQLYFGVDASQLNLPEAALMAGLIRGPSLYSPRRHPEAARQRRNLVLDLMRRAGFITDEQRRRASRAPLYVRRTGGTPPDAGYFFGYLTSRLRARHPGADLARAGLSVFSTLDSRLQRIAAKAVRDGLAELESRHRDLRGPGRRLQASLVALDPSTGHILAMMGGRDYGESQFNRAVDAHRQPGSAFKPLVALAALARGASGRVPHTLASALVDAPLAVPTTSGVWRPANYDGRFRGTVTLRQALELSLNVPFARLGVALGPERIRVTARRLGIVSVLRPFPSLALGASEVTLLELTGAYAVLAASGLHAQPSAIIQELGSDGRTLERLGWPAERVYSPAETYLVTSALRGAVERGTGRDLRALGYRGPVAAKSGTTNGFRDAWFVGYTPELAVGVWVGFDDGESIGLPGSRAALPMFTSFLRGALGAEGRARFRYPEGLERAEVTVYQGLGNDPECLGTTELFLNGTAPARRCHEYGRLANAWRDGGRPVLRLLEWLERRLERRVRRLLEVSRPGMEMAPRGGRHPSDRAVPATRVPGQRRRQL